MSDTLYSSCPSHPAQGACRGCALEDADHLIRKRLEAFKTDDLATRVAADLFVDWTGRYLGQYAKDEEVKELAGNAKRFGRIFAEAVAKEGK